MNFDSMIDKGMNLANEVPATPASGMLSGNTKGNLRQAIEYIDRTIGQKSPHYTTAANNIMVE